MDRDEFYQQNKSCVWVIQIIHDADRETNFSGFANSENTLLTCAHPFKKTRRSGMIQARRLDQEKFYNMRVKEQLPKSDIVMLTFNDESVKCVYSKIADNGRLQFQEPIFYIGHLGDFVGSLISGYTGYPCPDEVSASSFEHTKTCRDYKCTASVVPPPFRTIGDVWNEETLVVKYHDFEKKLNPLVPLIECVGIVFVDACVGGPVYKANGEIVGMLAMEVQGHSAAIHSTALKAFIGQAS